MVILALLWLLYIGSLKWFIIMFIGSYKMVYLRYYGYYI